MKKSFAVAFCLIILVVCRGQNSVLTLDLSKNVNGTYSQPINPQQIKQILLTNITSPPGKVTYSVSVQVQHTPQAPLQIPSGGNAQPPAAPGAAPAVIPAACQSLSNDIIALTSETDETKIPQEVSALQTDITGADAACANYVVQANQAIAATSQLRALSLPVTLGDGDMLKITISRGNVKWEFDYSTPTVNHWTVYYGFTYSPDIITHFRNYYANPNGNNTYTITAMNGQYNRNTFQNLSPSVLFTYRFFKKDNAICKFGLTGGFQYNTQTLGALAGPSIVIADNISINTGIGFLQKYRLKGQYTPGQIISDNLDYSQLHDQIWTFDMFFSIGFNIPGLFTKNTSSNSSPTKTATNGNGGN